MQIIHSNSELGYGYNAVSMKGKENMARQNEVFLYGMVMQEPQILTDGNGNYLRGSVPIQTIRGKREISNRQLVNVRFDAPIIMSGDPDVIETMKNLKPFDMVEVKGTYTTKDINRAKMCECGHKNIKQGTASFISPIYLGIRETGNTEAAGKQLLELRCEISNTITVIGNVTADPVYTEERTKMIQYTLAVTRKYFLKEDVTRSRVDFPHIKAFGSIAEEDKKRIRKGTKVMVNGMLQTRQYVQDIVCEECGKTLSYTASAMEIIPYSTEYLKDYVTDEELQEKQAAEAEKKEKELFGGEL